MKIRISLDQEKKEECFYLGVNSTCLKNIQSDLNFCLFSEMDLEKPKHLKRSSSKNNLFYSNLESYFVVKNKIPSNNSPENSTKKPDKNPSSQREMKTDAVGNQRKESCEQVEYFGESEP